MDSVLNVLNTVFVLFKLRLPDNVKMAQKKAASSTQCAFVLFGINNSLKNSDFYFKVISMKSCICT